MFLSFIQADAYEPLTIEAVIFSIKDKNVAADIADECTGDPKSAEVLTNVLNGDLIMTFFEIKLPLIE